MNAAAMLGRLRPDFRRLRLPRLPGFRPPFGRGRHRSGERGSRLPLLTGVGALAVLLGLGGLVYWLDGQAEETAHARAAAVPEVVVPVAGATPAAAMPPSVQPAPVPPKAAGTSQPAPAAPAAMAETGPPGMAAATAPPAVPPPPPGLPVPLPDGSIVLAAAPAPGLLEDSKQGPLPRTAEDGRKPWQVYARPFPPGERRPRIALLLADMGSSGVTTGNALQRLPPTVTLAFVPYAERLESWVQRARTKGHEVVLSVPMEPVDFPRSGDPGPHALFTSLAPDRNIERLEWSLAKVSGYVGITSTTGGKFTASADALKPVMESLRSRGLLFVDARVGPRSQGSTVAAQAGVPTAFVDRVIDRELARGAIDEQLHDLEAVALAQGSAVGLGFPYPTTIERIALWATGLADRGVVLAPVSAVVNTQKGGG